MIKIVAHREAKWMDSRADHTQWHQLTRAYGAELQLIDDDDLYDTIGTVVVVDQEGVIEIEDFTHTDDATYIFGRTNMSLMAFTHDTSVRIDTPNSISLFSVEAAAIVLQHRATQRLFK